MMMRRMLPFLTVFLLAVWAVPVSGQCNVTTLEITANDTEVGYLTSVNYPADYERNSDCSWRLVPGVPDANITLYIMDVDIEGYSSCPYDFLRIYDGYNATEGTPLGDAICSGNRQLGTVYVSQNGGFFFTFESDTSWQYKGFKLLYYATPTSPPQCDDSLTATTTTTDLVISPNTPGQYDPSFQCSYTITTSEADAFFRIVILFIDIETTTPCTNDKLAIYAGTDNTGTEVASLCQQGTDLFFDETYDIQNTSSVFIEFTTDADTDSVYYGFVFSYKAIVAAVGSTTCTATAQSLVLNAGDTASISTPGYSTTEYDNDLTCLWKITAATGYGVRVTFETTFSIENSYYCSYDYVAFYDGDSTSSTLLNKYCGNSAPTATISSSGRDLLVKFSSDYSITGTGFQIRYETYDTTYPICLLLYPQTFVNETTYTLSSTNYPSRYDSNTDEYFLFRTTNSSKEMVFDFVRVSIERARDCVYDRLIIYDGGCPSFPILYTICGYREPRYQLTGTDYLFHFHSDTSVNRWGFSVDYYLATSPTTPQPPATTVTAGPPVAAVVELMNEALVNYSKDLLPVRDLTSFVDSKINFYLVGINGLDEVSQKLTTTGQFIVTWRDDNLQWIPTKKANVVKMLIPQEDVWKPDIALVNGFDAIKQMGAKFMFIVVEFDGNCTWKPYQIMDSACQVDMTYYPYDTQECQLKFGTWASSDNDVKAELGQDGLKIHENFQQNSEWTLLGTSTSNETSGGQSMIVFTLRIKRNPSFVMFYMTVPIIMLAFSNVFTFALPLSSGEKSGFSITVFLSFVVFLIIVSQKMPANSENISHFAAYVLAMTVMSGVTLMMSVLELRLLFLDTKKFVIRPAVKTFIKAVLKVQSILMCQKKKEELTEVQALQLQKIRELYGQQKAEAENDDTADLIVPTPPPGQYNEDDEIKSINSETSSVPSMRWGRRSVTVLSEHGEEFNQTERQEVNEEEDVTWLHLVSALDFLLFWVILLVTVILTAAYLDLMIK